MAELGRSPRDRPSTEPNTGRRAVEATGEVAVEEITGETEGDPALTGEATVVGAGSPSIVAKWTAAEIFREIEAGVEDILRKVRSRAGGDGKLREGHGLPAK